jgi:predicted DNA-binding transcriptional regulator AlpA
MSAFGPRNNPLNERNSNAPPPLLVDVRTAARLIAVGERTLWRWVATGVFPPPDIAVGTKFRRWRRSTVEDWIVRQSEGQPVSREVE